MRELNSIAQLDKGFEDIALKLEGIYYQISDMAEEIGNIRDGIEYDPDMLEKIEERIDLIYRLKKKYGNFLAEGEFNASVSGIKNVTYKYIIGY